MAEAASALKPKFCIYCGSPVDPQGKFCAQCGKPLSAVVQNTPEPDNPAPSVSVKAAPAKAPDETPGETPQKPVKKITELVTAKAVMGDQLEPKINPLLVDEPVFVPTPKPKEQDKNTAAGDKTPQKAAEITPEKPVEVAQSGDTTNIPKVTSRKYKSTAKKPGGKKKVVKRRIDDEQTAAELFEKIANADGFYTPFIPSAAEVTTKSQKPPLWTVIGLALCILVLILLVKFVL